MLFTFIINPNDITLIHIIYSLSFHYHLQSSYRRNLCQEQAQISCKSTQTCQTLWATFSLQGLILSIRSLRIRLKEMMIVSHRFRNKLSKIKNITNLFCFNILTYFIKESKQSKQQLASTC